MTIDPKLRVAAVAGLAVALLIVAGALFVMPDGHPKPVTSTRTGLFDYRAGGPRFSSVSTLDGRGVTCMASFIKTQSNCQLAASGSRVEVDFAEVPTVFGRVEMAVAVRQEGLAIYSLNGPQLRERWLWASVFDAMFHAAIASALVYLGLIVRQHVAKRAPL